MPASLDLLAADAIDRMRRIPFILVIAAALLISGCASHPGLIQLREDPMYSWTARGEISSWGKSEGAISAPGEADYVTVERNFGFTNQADAEAAFRSATDTAKEYGWKQARETISAGLWRADKELTDGRAAHLLVSRTDAALSILMSTS